MRRYALATAALIALANHASAADLGPAVSGQIEAWSWTGCFAGAHAGGVWGDSGKWIPRTPGGAFEGVSLGGHSIDGFIGGVQGGCDYQMPSGVVNGEPLLNNRGPIRNKYKPKEVAAVFASVPGFYTPFANRRDHI
jgi:opacity protein-like surface antigen